MNVGGAAALGDALAGVWLRVIHGDGSAHGYCIERMSDTPKEERKQVSTEITAEFIRNVRELCQGAHIMPQGWDDIVPEAVRLAGLAD